MRCPICDYDPTSVEQSIFHTGLSLPKFKETSVTDGEFSCSCFQEAEDDTGYLDEEDIEIMETPTL